MVERALSPLWVELSSSKLQRSLPSPSFALSAGSTEAGAVLRVHDRGVTTPRRLGIRRRLDERRARPPRALGLRGGEEMASPRQTFGAPPPSMGSVAVYLVAPECMHVCTSERMQNYRAEHGRRNSSELLLRCLLGLVCLAFVSASRRRLAGAAASRGVSCSLAPHPIVCVARGTTHQERLAGANLFFPHPPWRQHAREPVGLTLSISLRGCDELGDAGRFSFFPMLPGARFHQLPLVSLGSCEQAECAHSILRHLTLQSF